MNDDLFLMAPKHSEDDDDPLPPTDTEFPIGSIIIRNQLGPIRFALALGIGWGLLFVIMAIIIAAVNGNTAALAVFDAIYPGFDATRDLVYVIIAGFSWSFLYGVISGLFIALLYNALVRQFVIAGGDGYETYG